MDSASFDKLSRLVAAEISRRGAFKSTVVSALSALGIASLPGADEAAAKKRSKRKRRKKRKSNGCTPSCGANTCGDNGCGGACGACEPNETCEHGTCVCVPECDGSTCGDDGCGGTCTCDDQSFCQDETCVPCDPPCPAGERCVHGTCTCDAFDNQCPLQGPTDRCTCSGNTVDGLGPTCAKKNAACDIDTPCTTHDDCPVGAVCKTTCVDPDDPLGPNRCSNPCIPA